MLIPELPDFLSAMGGKDYIGYIIALFTLTAGLSRPFSGKLTDTIGRMPVMIFGSIVCFICSGIYPFISSVGLFLLLRFVHGFSTGTKPTATAAYVADTTPEDRRGEAQGMLGIFTAIGMSMGPSLGSYITDWFGINFMFGLSSLFALFSILILINIKETLPKSQKKPFSFKIFKIKCVDVFEPRVKVVFWVMFLSSFGYGAILTLTPDQTKVLGISNKGLYFTIYTISSLLVRVFFSKQSDKKGRVPVLKFSILMLTISMILLAISNELWAFVLSSILFGFSWGFNSPTLTAWTIDLSEEKYRGRAIATMYIALEAGIGLGALVSGWIYQGKIENMSVIYWLSAILGGIGLYILLNQKPKNV